MNKDNTFPNNSMDYDSLFLVDDELDCLLMNDETYQKALTNVQDDSLDEPTDVSVDYDNDVVGTDITDIDADDIIAAERDIAINPFEDEELMIAVGDDEYDPTLDEEV